MSLKAVDRHDEVISHFRCPACRGGWSISEFESRRAKIQQQAMPCPHCQRTLLLDPPARWAKSSEGSL